MYFFPGKLRNEEKEKKFTFSVDLTRKTTVGSEPAQDMFVRVVFGWVLFTNAFKTASGEHEGFLFILGF